MTNLLRIENFALGCLALAAFWLGEGSWLLFAALILFPDISFLAYLVNARIGAFTYNLLHTWIMPVACFGLGWLLQVELLYEVGLIWAVHIGFDRALGYGLKYRTGFKDTHLGRIGKS